MSSSDHISTGRIVPSKFYIVVSRHPPKTVAGELLAGSANIHATRTKEICDFVRERRRRADESTGTNGIVASDHAEPSDRPLRVALLCSSVGR